MEKNKFKPNDKVVTIKRKRNYTIKNVLIGCIDKKDKNHTPICYSELYYYYRVVESEKTFAEDKLKLFDYMDVI